MSDKKTIFVTAGIIEKGDQTLIAKRMPDSRLAANKWEFPGGKIEFGEHPRECLSREIKEELDLTIEVNDLLDVFSHDYYLNDEKIHIIFMVYLAKYVSGELKNICCQDSIFETIDNFGKYDFAEADVQIVDSYLKLKSKI